MAAVRVVMSRKWRAPAAMAKILRYIVHPPVAAFTCCRMPYLQKLDDLFNFHIFTV